MEFQKCESRRNQVANATRISQEATGLIIRRNGVIELIYHYFNREAMSRSNLMRI